jgi:hypothetical protein
MPKHRSYQPSNDGSIALFMLLTQLPPARSQLKRTKELVRLSWAAAHLGLGRWSIASGLWPTDAAKDFVRQHPSKRKEVEELHQQVLAECARIKKGLAARRFRARRPAVERVTQDERRCGVCEAPLGDKRADARFCSAVCRVRHSRGFTPRSHRPS